jgi:cbb3-type cytochrome oxidase subunit 3
MPDTAISIQLRKWFRIMVFFNILMVLSVIFVATVGYIANKHRAKEGQQAHAFLCIQQDSLQDRVNNSEALLSGRIPASGQLEVLLKDKGFRKAVEQGIRRDMVTIANVKKAGIKCP